MTDAREAYSDKTVELAQSIMDDLEDGVVVAQDAVHKHEETAKVLRAELATARRASKKHLREYRARGIELTTLNEELGYD